MSYVGQNLDANLHLIQGGQRGDPGAPGEWFSILAKHLPEIHTITLRYRRGGQHYRPMPVPNATWVLSSVDFDDAPKKDAKDDFRIWTGDQAQQVLDTDVWPKCMRIARAEGPVLDVQLSVYGYDEKTGKLDLLCDASGTRINLDPHTPNRIDDPYDNRTDAMVTFMEAQTDAIKERDAANKALMSSSIELVKAVTGVTTGTLEVAKEAIGMKSEVAGRNDEAAERARRHELEKLLVQKRHESFKAALDRFPFDDLGLFWRAKAAGVNMEQPTDCRDAAARLLDTFTDEQLAQLDPDLAGDIRSVLSKAAAEPSEEMAQLILIALLPKLLEHQESISKVINPEQAALLTFLQNELQKMNA